MCAGCGCSATWPGSAPSPPSPRRTRTRRRRSPSSWPPWSARRACRCCSAPAAGSRSPRPGRVLVRHADDGAGRPRRDHRRGRRGTLRTCPGRCGSGLPDRGPHAAARRAGLAGREHPGLELMVTELDPVAVPGRAARAPARRRACCTTTTSCRSHRTRPGRGAAAGRDGVPRGTRRTRRSTRSASRATPTGSWPARARCATR